MTVLGPRETVLRVEPNGGGDFESVAAAMASITDSSPSKPYLIRLGIGVDTLTSNIVAKNFVTIRGVNKHLSIMRFEQPDDTPVDNIKQSQVMYTTARLRLENLTAEVRNARYVFHTDSNNLYNLNSVIEMVSVIVRHLGNDGAMDYQASLVDQNDPAAIAAARAAVAGSVPLGTGLGSGDYLLLDDVDAEGPWGAGFGAHNNVGSTEPATFIIRNCRSSARETAKYTTFTCLGSLQADKVIIVGSDIGDGVNYTCPNWPTVPASQQPAFRCEWGVSGYANQPFAFRVTMNDARALRITSADKTAATKVEVDTTSSAAPLLFKTVMTLPGGAGLAAGVRSWFDVSGKTAGTSLGQRLGDCRAVNKILRVRFQGGAWKVVTFNTDLTNASNDDVLVIIRAAVGDAGVVDLWDVARETFRPRIRDEEKSLRNTTTTAIRRGMALAYNGARDAVRPMTSADAADLFAGIAWENILPGKTGRVKTAGYLPFEDVRCTGLDSLGNGLQFNQTLSIDADEPGKLFPAPNGIMRVIRAAADGLSAVVAVR